MRASVEIRERLTEAFSPEIIDVIDESEAHRGHAGFREGGESHFRVTIRAPTFAGMPRLARHRAIHAALGAELMGRIHALALDVSG